MVRDMDIDDDLKNKFDRLKELALNDSTIFNYLSHDEIDFKILDHILDIQLERLQMPITSIIFNAINEEGNK